MNEVLFTRLSGSPRYKVFLYNEVRKNPKGVAEEALTWAGLDLSEDTKSRVIGTKNTLFRRPHVVEVDRNMVSDLAEQVLRGSPLLSLLPEFGRA
jgi:hypothetical protein